MSASRYLSLTAGLLSALLLIQGCGSADSSTSRNRGSIGDGGGGGGGGGGGDNGGALPVVDVRVEGTEGIARAQSLAARLLHSLLPAQAHALTGLKTLNVQKIRVVRVDHDGNVVSETPFNNNPYAVEYGNPDGSHSIKFTANYEGAMDLVIEATLPNGVILRRPLPTTRKDSDGQPYSINIATEYAMNRFFQQVDDEEFRSMVNCAADDSACTTRATQKLLGWLGLFEGVVDFDISLPEELNFSAALEFLDNQIGFSRFVDRSINTIRTDIIGGSDDRGGLPDPVQAAVGTYNGLSFTMELNQGKTASGESSAVLANWTSAVATLTSDDAGSIQYYPYVTLSNLGTSLISTLITGDMPRLRNQLTQEGPTSFEPVLIDNPEKKKDAQRNFLGVSGVFSTLTTQGFHDFGVLQTQSVTGQGSDEQLTGWLTNPYFSSLYDATAQSSLLEARVSDGAVYNLAQAGNSYSRQSLRESVNSFSFHAYSKRAPDRDKKPNSGDDFQEAALDGKAYGLVGLFQKFSDPEVPVQVSASIRHWRADAAARQIQESQPAGELFQTWTLSRDASNQPNPPSASRADAVARDYRALASEMYDATTGQTYQSYNGRLSVNAQGDAWEGISDIEARFLSFVINNAAEGQGIAHAVQLHTNNQEPPSGTYRLVGNGFGFNRDTGSNFLFHVDNAQLVFGLGGSVQLRMNQVRAVQDATTQTVSGLTKVTFDREPVLVTDSTRPDFDPARYAFGDGDIRNSIRMVFEDPSATGTDELILEGFLTAQDSQKPEAGGRVMVLRMRYGDSIGLVYGFHEKDLTAD